MVQRRDFYFFHFVVKMCLPLYNAFFSSCVRDFLFCFRDPFLSCIIIKKRCSIPVIVNHLILFLINRVSGENKGFTHLQMLKNWFYGFFFFFFFLIICFRIFNFSVWPSGVGAELALSKLRFW
jgi:hypothetical protein